MSKSLVYDKEYIDSIADKLIVLDNTFLVDLSKDDDDELVEFLNILKANRCILVTIPEVFQEFTRGAKSITQYKKFENIFNDLGIKIIKNIDKVFRDSSMRKFTVAYNNEAAKPSLTDLKLVGCLFAYSHIEDMRLLTANYRDMPQSLLRRDGIIAYDMRGEIRTHGFYRVQDSHILRDNIEKYDN